MPFSRLELLQGDATTMSFSLGARFSSSKNEKKDVQICTV
jgi:hypothetical protein